LSFHCFHLGLEVEYIKELEGASKWVIHMRGKCCPNIYAFDMVKEHPTTLKVTFGHSFDVIHHKPFTPSGHFENMACFQCVLSHKHVNLNKIIYIMTFYF
jgi:hypothetical protein